MKRAACTILWALSFATLIPMGSVVRAEGSPATQPAGTSTVPAALVSGPENSDVGKIVRFPGDWAYYVFLARVEPAETADGQPLGDLVRLVVEKNYNSAMRVPREFVLPTWTLWRGAHPSDRWEAQKPAMGSHVVVCMPNDLPEQAKYNPDVSVRVYYTVVDTAQTTGPHAAFIHGLELIAAYRNAADADKPKAAMAILTSQIDLPLIYLCSKWPTKGEQPADVKTQLLAVRDNENLGAYTRMLASEVLHYHDAAYGRDQQHYAWLCRWLAQAYTLDFQTWENLLNELDRFTPQEERPKFELLLWPLYKQALLNPKIDDTERQAILLIVPFVGFRNDIPLDSKHAIAAFLFDQTARQATEAQALMYLQAAREFLTELSPRTGELDDIIAYRMSLPKYTDMLHAMVIEPQSVRLQAQVEGLLDEMSFWEQQPFPPPPTPALFERLLRSAIPSSGEEKVVPPRFWDTGKTCQVIQSGGPRNFYEYFEFFSDGSLKAYCTCEDHGLFYGPMVEYKADGSLLGVRYLAGENIGYARLTYDEMCTYNPRWPKVETDPMAYKNRVSAPLKKWVMQHIANPNSNVVLENFPQATTAPATQP